MTRAIKLLALSATSFVQLIALFLAGSWILSVTDALFVGPLTLIVFLATYAMILYLWIKLVQQFLNANSS